MSAVESLQNQLELDPEQIKIRPAATMQAAVYTGNGRVEVASVPVPRIDAGEVLIRVESCGICHTDLKKIEYGLLAPPRIYGHETAGVVVASGEGVRKFAPDDRVIVFHHVPCGTCFYCQRKLYAQCALYKKVGVTAGYEPAGGGFAQYVRAMDWIVERGMEHIPQHVSFDQACWVEPVNTCLKAVRLLGTVPGDIVAVLGQGPIGLIFTMLLAENGAQVFATDGIGFRRDLSESFGAQAFDPRDIALERSIRNATDGRGADAVVLATNAKNLVEQAIRISRPGAKILLFAQTAAAERLECSGADICVGERVLFGSYSADIDMQAESARLVFSGVLPLERLISHRLPLHEISRGIEIAQRPSADSLKVVIHPQDRN